MATLEEMQARLETLRAVRAGGAREVRTEGRAIVYGSDAELAAAIAAVEREILGQTGVPVRHVVVASSKGLDG